MTILRHGRWQDPSQGGHHNAYCNTTGAHITRRCGVAHQGMAGPCPATRLWCPVLGASIDPHQDDIDNAD